MCTSPGKTHRQQQGSRGYCCALQDHLRFCGWSQCSRLPWALLPPAFLKQLYELVVGDRTTPCRKPVGRPSERDCSPLGVLLRMCMIFAAQNGQFALPITNGAIKKSRTTTINKTAKLKTMPQRHLSKRVNLIASLFPAQVQVQLISSGTRSAQEHPDSLLFVRDANNPRNREWTKAIALWLSLKFKALCTESR